MKLKYPGIILLVCFSLMSCMMFEGDYEVINNSQLEDAGIESPFPDFTFKRDESGRTIFAHNILGKEGYRYERSDGGLNNKISFNNNSIKLRRLMRTYLSDEYVIFKDGVSSITDDGLIRPLIYPYHRRLNLFKRDTFELLDQRVIHGRVLNVKITDDYIYFVAEKDGHRFNARYLIPE